MPKQKSHRGAAKRFKVTASGKVLRGQANTSHMFTCKSQKRKRKLRKTALVAQPMEKTVKKLLLKE